MKLGGTDLYFLWCVRALEVVSNSLTTLLWRTHRNCHPLPELRPHLTRPSDAHFTHLKRALFSNTSGYYAVKSTVGNDKSSL